jgi:hypothetical protein
MWLSDSYDVPQALVDDPPSPAFRQYLLNWFGSNRVSFSELLRAANNLTPEETAVARQLIRRNLKCGYSHIISGTWALDDLEAVPHLRAMFDAEPDESRRLVMAGALWKLNRDPVFIECLNRAKESGLLSVYFHLQQILWLNDERSIDFLIDLLPLEDRDPSERRLLRLRNLCWHTPFRGMTMRIVRDHNLAKGAGSWALSLLNHIETGQLVPKDEQRPPSYYRERRNDPAFREMMLQAIHKSIAQVHQGH